MSLIARIVHVDHIIPRSSGGTNDLDNLALTCQYCNMAKSSTSLDEYLSWIEHLRQSETLFKPGDFHPTSRLHIGNT